MARPQCDTPLVLFRKIVWVQLSPLLPHNERPGKMANKSSQMLQTLGQANTLGGKTKMKVFRAELLFTLFCQISTRSKHLINHHQPGKYYQITIVINCYASVVTRLSEMDLTTSGSQDGSQMHIIVILPPKQNKFWYITSVI